MFVNNFLAPIQVRLSPNFVSYTIGYRGRGDLNFGRSRSLEQVCALLNDLLVNSALRCDCRQQRRFLITAFHHSRNSQWRWHFTNLNQKWRAINKQPAESGKRVAGNYVDIQLSVCATVRHWSATPANSLNASTHLITITSVQTGTHWLTVSELRLHDVKDKSKGFPYSLPSVGPGTDPGVQTVSPQVTISHPPGGRLPLLLSAKPAVTFPAGKHHRPLAGTKLSCLLSEAHRCEQLAKGWLFCYPLRHGATYTTYS